MVGTGEVFGGVRGCNGSSGIGWDRAWVCYGKVCYGKVGGGGEGWDGAFVVGVVVGGGWIDVFEVVRLSGWRLGVCGRGEGGGKGWGWRIGSFLWWEGCEGGGWGVGLWVGEGRDGRDVTEGPRGYWGEE